MQGSIYEWREKTRYKQFCTEFAKYRFRFLSICFPLKMRILLWKHFNPKVHRSWFVHRSPHSIENGRFNFHFSRFFVVKFLRNANLYNAIARFDRSFFLVIRILDKIAFFLNSIDFFSKSWVYYFFVRPSWKFYEFYLMIDWLIDWLISCCIIWYLLWNVFGKPRENHKNREQRVYRKDMDNRRRKKNTYVLMSAIWSFTVFFAR